jgi:hypothetical protein
MLTNYNYLTKTSIYKVNVAKCRTRHCPHAGHSADPTMPGGNLNKRLKQAFDTGNLSGRFKRMMQCRERASKCFKRTFQAGFLSGRINARARTSVRFKRTFQAGV